MAILGPRPTPKQKRNEWLDANRRRAQLERGMRRRLATEFRRVARVAADAFADDGQAGVSIVLDDHGPRLAAIFAADIRRTFRVFGARTRRSAKMIKSLELKDEVTDFANAQAEYLEEVGAEKVVQISESTKRKIGNTIAEGVQDGENRAQISRRIRNLGVKGAGTFDPSLRAAVIARTEIHSAANAAEDEIVKAMGLQDEVRREWLDSDDDRIRDTHRTSDWTEDERVKSGTEPFNVGGAILRFPGDPLGPAKEIILCRCSVGYLTPDPLPDTTTDQPGFESGDFKAADYNGSFDDFTVSGEQLLAERASDQLAEIERIRNQIKASRPTDVLHKVDGTWTAKRARLHSSIINEFLNEDTIKAATPAAGQQPVATFFGGRGGSGKGWFTRAKGDGGAGTSLVDKSKTVVLDPDEVKKRLFAADGVDGRLAGLYHEESSVVYSRIVDKARELKLNVVLDRTLKTTSSSIEAAKSFQQAGYQLDGFYMYLPRQEAGRRAISRTFGKQKRYVPVEVVLANQTNEETFDALTPLFRRWRFYDNQVPQGSDPRLVAGNF